jgi:hypothetical protein
MAPDLPGSVVRRLGAGIGEAARPLNVAGLDVVAFALILGTVGLAPLVNRTQQIVIRWTHWGLF